MPAVDDFTSNYEELTDVDKHRLRMQLPARRPPRPAVKPDQCVGDSSELDEDESDNCFEKGDRVILPLEQKKEFEPELIFKHF